LSPDRLFKQLALMVCGFGLLVPYLTAAELEVQQSYYSIQLLSGEPVMIKNAWHKVYELSYARIEKHAGQYMLRIGFWNNKQHATKQLALIRKNFPDAYILQAQFEPNKIVRGWTTNINKKTTSDTIEGRVDPLPLPPNLVLRQEYSQPEILAFKDRHEIWLEGSLIKPVKKPFFPSHPVVTEPAKKQKAMPNEAPLWRLYNNEKYDVLQAEIIRIRRNYPNWHPPKKLLNLLLQGEIARKINQSIRENDAAMLIHMAELYPDVFTCDRIDWAWALADARTSLKHTSSLIFGLHRLIPDCSEQDRLATLYKARNWLDTDKWEKLLEREAKAYRTSLGENKFQNLRYSYQTEKLLAAYQAKDSISFRALLSQLESEIERLRDIDTALLVGWHYYNTRETAAAETWFNKALVWDPNQHDALRGLSLSAMQDGRFSDAQYFARKLPTSSEVRKNILSNTMASTDSPSSPESTSIALAGGELNPGNSFAYVGAIMPLPSRFGDGFVQRYWVDRLTYSFDDNGRKIDAEQWGAEVLLGYRKFHNQGWWAAYVGPAYRNIQFSPNFANISNSGSAFRGKIQLEGEQILSDAWRVNAIASYVTGQHNYWVRGRLLHTANNRIFIGPEVITLGDTNFQIVQLGWAILAAEVLPKTDVGVKFGVRKAKGLNATGYIGIELGRSF
jgi:cellulose biosynthesis protein BcsS